MGAYTPPCVGVCTLDLPTKTCLGCGRTLKEIEWWTRYSEAQRAEVCARLPRRLAALEAKHIEEAARIAGRWPQSKCSACGSDFVCGATDCSTPCWCASYPPVEPVEGARCLCPACLAATAAQRVHPEGLAGAS